MTAICFNLRQPLGGAVYSVRMEDDVGINHPRMAKAEQLRKEIHFLKNLLTTASSVEAYVAAARAASKLAARATKELQAAAAAREAVITVRNVPAAWTWMRMKVVLDQLGIKVIRVDKGPDWDKAILTISDRTLQESIIQKLTGYEVEGTAFAAEPGAPSAAEMSELRLLAHKSTRRLEAAAGVAAKMQRSHQRAQVLAGACRAPDNVASVVCSWFDRPYPDQLEAKRLKVEELMGAIGNEVAKRCGDAPGSWPSWLQEQRQGGGAASESAASSKPVAAVVRSPFIHGYRNKSDMAIGLDSSEKQVEVGFFLGATADGITAVADPEPTVHTSQTAKAYAHIVRSYVNRSNLPPWDKRCNPSNGFWRLLTVREARSQMVFPGEDADQPTFSELDVSRYTVSGPLQKSDEAMVQTANAVTPSPDEVVLVVQVNHEFTDESFMMAELKALAVHVQQEASSQGLPLTGILAHCHSALSITPALDAKVIQLLTEAEQQGRQGEQAESMPVLHETICDVKFCASPLTFFQVNPGTAALMSKVVSDWLCEGCQPTVTLALDGYCGIGLFAVTLASRFAQVIGIDSSSAAIADAVASASYNSVQNCKFMAGKAEELLPSVLSTHGSKYDNVVAVLDPPRGGLHAAALQQLLNFSRLKRIVYVSTNLDTLAANLADLCGGPRPLKQGQRPRRRDQATSVVHAAGCFKPIKAIGIDMYPHTAQLQAVVLLERV